MLNQDLHDVKTKFVSTVRSKRITNGHQIINDERNPIQGLKKLGDNDKFLKASKNVLHNIQISPRDIKTATAF